MVDYPRPNVVVSKCLEFAACRYNGQLIRDDFVKKLNDYVNFIPVCPEFEIGLGIPRFPVRLVDADGETRLIQPATNNDVTEKMHHFAENFLNPLQDVDGFILKYRSPSCGLKNVRLYVGAQKPGLRGTRSGLFAGHVIEKFSGLAIEDEGRLKSFKIREHFLTKLYTLARFRGVKQAQKIRALVEFHSTHKFLLMAYHQKMLNVLGNIVANHEKRGIKEQLNLYEANLHAALQYMPRRTSLINVLYHLVGFFSKINTEKEKAFFEETIQLYRETRISFRSIIVIIKTWALRDSNDYLLDQTILNPYPVGLMELSDAGRVLDL